MKKIIALILTLLLVLAMGAVVQAAPTDDGLVLYYSFDDVEGTTVKGAGSKAVDATATDNVTYAAGKVGNAAVFDGTTTSILSPGVAEGFTDISVSVWVNVKDVPMDDTVPYAIFGSKTWQNGALHCHINKGLLGYAICGLTDTDPSARKTEIQLDWQGMDTLANQWVNVVVTYDSTSKVRCLYLNGTLVDTSVAEAIQGGKILIGDFEIGSWTTDPARNINAAIDEFRVYNRAITADEVKEIAGNDVTVIPAPTEKPAATEAPTEAPATEAPTEAPATTAAAATAAPTATTAPKDGGSAGTVILIIAAVLVVGGAAFLILKKKK